MYILSFRIFKSVSFSSFLGKMFKFKSSFRLIHLNEFKKEFMFVSVFLSGGTNGFLLFLSEKIKPRII